MASYIEDGFILFDGLDSSGNRRAIKVAVTAGAIASSGGGGGGDVLESDWDAQTILLAVADDTPLPLVITPSTFVGRKATGDAGIMSAAEAVAVLHAESEHAISGTGDPTTSTGTTKSVIGQTIYRNTTPDPDEFWIMAGGAGGTSATWLKLAKDVVDDTTPQLGGTLDGNDKEINNFKGTINAQTGTTYPTVASDTGKVITLNNASPVTITVHSTAAAGFNCTIIQKGAGQVTVAAGGSGTILNKSSHTKLSGQYAIGALFVESNAGTAPQVYFGGDTAA